MSFPSSSNIISSVKGAAAKKHRYEQVVSPNFGVDSSAHADDECPPSHSALHLEEHDNRDENDGIILDNSSPVATTRSRSRILFYAITSSLAGLLFGFDTVVISGAEQQIQQQWALSDSMHGLVISMAIWGTVVGSIVGAWPPELFGRVKTLFLIGILYVVSAIWSAAAQDEYSFMVARFIGGLGVGISTVTSPLYNSEISPPEWRGRLAGLFQFQIGGGILLAYISNAIIMAMMGDTHPEQAWRWMMGVAAVPAFMYTLLSCGLPESPRWLVTHRQDSEGALKVLQKVQPDTPIEELRATLHAIEREAHQDNNTQNSNRHDRFWSRRLARPIFLAITIGLFNQLSGINAILYFAPRIFELTGLESQVALLQSIGIGITNLVFTFIGLYLIDRLGRKTLLLIGTVGYIITLLALSLGFWLELYGIVPWAIFGFIGAHAIGQGAVIWVFLAEIFPTKYRSKGQGLGSFAHWINAALISTFFPEEVDATSPQFAFFLFAIFMMIALVWVICCVPETKGVPLEDIGKVLGFDVAEDETEDDKPMLESVGDNGANDDTSKYTDQFTIDDENDDVFIDEIEMGKVPRDSSRAASSLTEHTDTSSSGSNNS